MVGAPSALLISLAPLSRDALAVLALEADHPRSRSHWLARSVEAGLVDERGRRLSQERFKGLIDELVSVGAVVRDARHEHDLAAPWLVPVIEDTHRRERLVPIARRLVPERRYGWSGAAGMRAQLLAGLASGDAKLLEDAQAPLRSILDFSRNAYALTRLLGLEAPQSWIARLDPVLALAYLREAVEVACAGASKLGDGPRQSALASMDEDLRAQIAILLALGGEGARALASMAPEARGLWTRGARAFIALTDGDFAVARQLFAAAALGARGKRVELPGMLAVFDVLLAVTSDRGEEVGDVTRRMDKNRRVFARYPSIATTFDELAELRRTGQSRPHRRPMYTWLDALVGSLAELWMGQELSAPAAVEIYAKHARHNGYAWLADQLDRVLTKNPASLLALFGRKEGWELSLESLAAAAHAPPPTATTTRPKKGAEIWWTVTVHPDVSWVDVEAFRVSKAGAKGTKVSLVRMLDENEPDVTAHDRRIAEALRRAQVRGEYAVPGTALLTLADHPRVRDAIGRTIRIVRKEPALLVEKTAEGARVRLVPSRFDSSGVALARLDEERIVVFVRTPEVARIAEALPPQGIHVPAAGLSRLTEVLATVSEKVRVEAADSLVKESSSGDPRIHAQVFRAANSMRVRLRVLPTGESGPALRPGVPPAETVVRGASGLVRIYRDLADERKRLETLLERCPILAGLPQEGDDRLARDLETSLELLIELRESEADITIDWLEGSPLRAPAERGASDARVRIKGDATWLSVDAELRVDDTRVIAMRDLLAGASRAQGRFVPIGDDEYIALTDDLRKKLGALDRVSTLGKDGRVSSALLPALDELCEGLDVSFTEQLTKRRDALARAQEVDAEAPRGLTAELRDYQRDGFLFLARKTDSGLGACLADDMGLGKTVQALALLLHRRKKGPALVIAPTSVCRNWEDEARRFAPSLTIKSLGAGDRADCVGTAGAGDIVIASYGLLVAEEELLASRTWGTVVYDEAHALKNASTRRWAAARRLRPEATVALTGTPVENHAGELHALIDLLVPGMLGSRVGFDRAMGQAIGEGDRDAARLLRRLVRPFILRRTKGEVLSELPPRTEVLHVVPASAEHLAFYEAVRRRAVEKIEAARSAGGARARRAQFEVLAEITRLRRAAIDPRLVGGADAPAGSKLEAFGELATELRAEGRRALVFSQFLEVLDLARAELDQRGLSSCRLDGTMTADERAKTVASFQSGQGDVFLVSLKAGGVGMNLTAADVVILLDPWWNPAVEDQAAGRAHRIGQTRPVTVARIVTEHTIEEKVLALHEKKRKLYDDVISEADGAGTLDVEMLASLLADDTSPRPAAKGRSRASTSRNEA